MVGIEGRDFDVQSECAREGAEGRGCREAATEQCSTSRPGSSSLRSMSKRAPSPERTARIVKVASAITAVAGAIAALLALVPSDASPPAPSITNVIQLSPEERRAKDQIRSDDWPGGPGFTAILASLDSVVEARAIQRRASDLGLDAGVLLSDDFASLRRGYWVVFSGIYESNASAEQRVARARALGFKTAYPRFVSP